MAPATGNEIYRSNVLKRPLKNSVGAGDSMIAGFIGRYAKTKDVVEAFKWGVACGSATAFSDDLAEASFIEELLPEVIIEQVNLWEDGKMKINELMLKDAMIMDLQATDKKVPLMKW